MPIYKTKDLESIKGRNGQMIISKGFAQLYTETGVPLAEMEKHATANNYRISWLNVAKDFLRLGFSSQKITSEFRELSTFQPNAIDLLEVERFLSGDVETQRLMLSDYWRGVADMDALLEDELLLAQKQMKVVEQLVLSVI